MKKKGTPSNFYKKFDIFKIRDFQYTKNLRFLSKKTSSATFASQSSTNKKKMAKGTSLWKALLFERRLPWRYVHEGGFWNAVLLKKIRPYYLRPILFFRNLGKKEDITVIIGVKNRYDDRIKNTFKGIREQDYPQDLIKIVLVDYDSKKEFILKCKKLCSKYDVEYIRVDNQPVWSRSHCLNIGIKRADTNYILTSDTDIIFEKNYIKEAINELKKNPFQVVLSYCLDLPKEYNKNVTNFEELQSLAKRRFEYDYPSKGINLTLTYFYHKLRGYDEKYKIWGVEDDDLLKRFQLLGLKLNCITSKSSYLHQWHPRYEGVKKKDYKKQIEKNQDYLNKNNSIVRNKEGWGDG